MRTNIVIDERLMEEAKELTGLPTKRAVVEEALRTLVQIKRQEEILKLKGKVHWQGDLNKMRRTRSLHGGRR